MSCWMDASVTFVVKGSVSVSKFQRIVGRECDWDSILEMDPDSHPELYLPLGSEGTLLIYPVSMKKNKTTYRVAGNLRDRWSINLTVNWFNRVIQHPDVLEAFGSTCLDGGGKPVELYYKNPKKWG